MGSSILTGAVGRQNGPSDVVGGLGATLDPVSPQVLISNLPPSLQPSTTTFYFSPQQEAIQLQQPTPENWQKSSYINPWTLKPGATENGETSDSAPLPQWGNTATNVVKIEILTCPRF
ncbi:tRNA nuclease CdiA-2 [Pandoraea captiosa]|uniref:tRNA nuclease CdiA-2 n=1 Tax=Pandoraea captiosa TaxID=2508302 RepID=A0A5E5AL36_9BURK|nr:tRNA nuclease CdiA-2 [Pandoraea captiosa]